MSKTTGRVNINNRDIRISNMNKVLWPELKITKIKYIKKLLELAPYILPYSKDRLLTGIHYPDGVDGKSFYQKNKPDHAPEFIKSSNWHDNDYILLNDVETLVWLGNMATLELHTSFDRINIKKPDCIVFDLDPSKGQTFDEVVKGALLVNETLNSLNIKSFVKTSGATGLQIYINIGAKYNYEQTRKINEFFGKYFSQKHPEIFTVERITKKRGKKIYFDYLQLWQGKTIITPYSPRATKEATIAAPITWEELKQGITPMDFTLLNITDRLNDVGDLFSGILDPEKSQDLDFILEKA